MARSAAESRERFSGIFEGCYALVRAFAVRRVGRDLADEVTAETFLVAWRRLDAVPADPLPWLYGVARNVILRQLSASARQARVRELMVRERPPAFEDDADHEALWRAWERLGETDREVLALTVWEELPVRDGARVLGIPARVFSVRLHRARRRLEKELSAELPAAIATMQEAT